MKYIKGHDLLDLNYKIDLNKMLTDMLSTDAMRQAGVTKDLLWQVFLNEIQNADEANVFSNYGKYYLIITEYAGNDSLFNCFINETGNLFKIVFPKVLSFGLGDKEITEVILTKK